MCRVLLWFLRVFRVFVPRVLRVFLGFRFTIRASLVHQAAFSLAQTFLGLGFRLERD